MAEAPVDDPKLLERLFQEGDAVNHPAHYGGADNPYEVIKVLKSWLTPEEFRGAMKFNYIKYVARAGKKDPSKTAQDYAKAAFYLKQLMELES